MIRHTAGWMRAAKAMSGSHADSSRSRPFLSSPRGRAPRCPRKLILMNDLLESVSFFLTPHLSEWPVPPRGTAVCAWRRQCDGPLPEVPLSLPSDPPRMRAGQVYLCKWCGTRDRAPSICSAMTKVCAHTPPLSLVRNRCTLSLLSRQAHVARRLGNINASQWKHWGGTMPCAVMPNNPFHLTGLCHATRSFQYSRVRAIISLARAACQPSRVSS